MKTPFQLIDGLLDVWCGDDRLGQEDPVFLLHEGIFDPEVLTKIEVKLTKLRASV